MKKNNIYPRLDLDFDFDFNIDKKQKQKEIIERILKAREVLTGHNLSSLKLPAKRYRIEDPDKNTEELNKKTQQDLKKNKTLEQIQNSSITQEKKLTNTADIELGIKRPFPGSQTELRETRTEETVLARKDPKPAVSALATADKSLFGTGGSEKPDSLFPKNLVQNPFEKTFNLPSESKGSSIIGKSFTQTEPGFLDTKKDFEPKSNSGQPLFPFMASKDSTQVFKPEPAATKPLFPVLIPAGSKEPIEVSKSPFGSLLSYKDPEPAVNKPQFAITFPTGPKEPESKPSLQPQFSPINSKEANSTSDKSLFPASPAGATPSLFSGIFPAGKNPFPQIKENQTSEKPFSLFGSDLKNISYIPKDPGLFSSLSQDKLNEVKEGETTKRAKLVDDSEGYPKLEPLSQEKLKEAEDRKNTTGVLKTEFITSPLVKNLLDKGSNLFNVSTQGSDSKNLNNVLFGQSKTPNQAGSLLSGKFDTSLFSGKPAGSLFSNQPAGSLFSNQPAGSLFSNQPAGSLFSNQPAGSLFSNQPAGSLFSNKPSTVTTQKPELVSSLSSSNSLFGNPSIPPQPAPAMKLPTQSSHPFFVQNSGATPIDNSAFIEEEGYASGADSGPDED